MPYNKVGHISRHVTHLNFALNSYTIAQLMQMIKKNFCLQVS